eukprot:12429779-Karenia_brevis.AAC.1
MLSQCSPELNDVCCALDANACTLFSCTVVQSGILIATCYGWASFAEERGVQNLGAPPGFKLAELLQKEGRKGRTVASS